MAADPSSKSPPPSTESNTVPPHQSPHPNPPILTLHHPVEDQTTLPRSHSREGTGSHRSSLREASCWVLLWCKGVVRRWLFISYSPFPFHSFIIDPTRNKHWTYLNTCMQFMYRYTYIFLPGRGLRSSIYRNLRLIQMVNNLELYMSCSIYTQRPLKKETVPPTMTGGTSLRLDELIQPLLRDLIVDQPVHLLTL